MNEERVAAGDQMMSGVRDLGIEMEQRPGVSGKVGEWVRCWQGATVRSRCEHPLTGMEEMYGFLNRPGEVICRDCLKEDPDDERCDACGRTVTGGYDEVVFRAGVLTLVFGAVCPTCFAEAQV